MGVTALAYLGYPLFGSGDAAAAGKGKFGRDIVVAHLKAFIDVDRQTIGGRMSRWMCVQK